MLIPTHVTDNKEADDIFKAFFTASVAEIEASTDLALAETMYGKQLLNMVLSMFLKVISLLSE